MEVLVGFAVLALVVAVAAWLVRRVSRVITIHDYEGALEFRDGTLIGLRNAGRHRLWGSRTRLEPHDLRPDMISVAGQEITTADHIAIRVSLVGQSRVVDLVKAFHDRRDSQQDLYVALQLATRDAVVRRTVDEVLQQRDAIAQEVMAAVQPQAQGLGLDVLSLAVRDVTLPADLKRAMAGVLQAQKESQRELEKARGEQAVLRSLANAGRLFEGNPGLLQARLIQALERGGNTLVFGSELMPPGKPKTGKS